MDSLSSLFGSLLCILLLTCSLVYSRRGVHPILLNGNPYFPGLQLKLTKSGLDYINVLAGKVLDRQLPKMKLPDADRQLPNNQGRIIMKNLKLKDFKRASRYDMEFVPDDSIRWSMTNMNMGLTGDISGRYVMVLPFDLMGQLDTQLNGIDFSMTNRIDRDPQGRPRLKTVSCTATARNMDLVIHNGGLVGLLLGLFKNLAIQQIKPQVLKEICDTSRQMMDTRGAEILATMPTMFPLTQGDALADFSGSLSDPQIRSQPMNLSLFDFGKQMQQATDGDQPKDGLWLDYRLIESPKVFPTALISGHKGEVSWRGIGRTPFYPTRIMERNFSPEKQFYVYATDYVANSLMYHAYRNGLMRFRVTPDNPELAQFLQTSCDEGFFDVCLGDMIPELQDKYPSRKLEILFYPTRAPAIIFNSNGSIMMDAKGVFFIFVRSNKRKGKKRQVISSTVDMKADTKVQVKGQSVTGEMTLKEFKFTLKQTEFKDFDASVLEELSDFSGSLIESMANDLLGKGLPMPLIKGMKLIQPRITTMNRVIRVETNVGIDEAALNRMADSAMENFG